MQSIEHKHADGHGAYTTWYGCYSGAHGSYLLEVHIALKTETGLSCFVDNTGGTHVNNNGTRFNHVCGYESRTTNSSNQNVCLTAYLGKVLGMRVQNGNGGVAILLLHHEHRHGFAYDVGTTENGNLLATSFNIVTLKQGEYAERSCRNESRQTD